MKTKTTQTNVASKGIEDAKLTELQAENARLKAVLRERDAHDSLKHKLKEAGAHTPKLLLEAAKHALQFTAAGELENAAAIIESLKGRFPEQFAHGQHFPSVSIDAGAGRVPRPQLTRDSLAKMKPAEIAELDWNEVRQVLSQR